MQTGFRKKTASMRTVVMLLLVALPLAPTAQIVESAVIQPSSPAEDIAVEPEATPISSSVDSRLVVESVSSDVEEQSVDTADFTAVNSESSVAAEQNDDGFYGGSYRGGRAPQMRGIAVEPQHSTSVTTTRELVVEKPQTSTASDSAIGEVTEQPQADTMSTRHHIRPFQLVAGIVGVVVVAGGTVALLLAQKQEKNQESAFPSPPPVPEY